MGLTEHDEALAALRRLGSGLGPRDVRATHVVTSGGLDQVLVVRVDDSPTPQHLGEVAARAIHHADDCDRVVSALPHLAAAEQRAHASELVAEGITLGAYAYRRPDHPAVDLVGDHDPASTRIGLRTGRMTNHARRLVERPAGDLDPLVFVGECVALLEGAGLQCEVWDDDELGRRGFGATVAVGRGSSTGAKVVVGRRAGRTRHLGLTGKGITFDSGGVNIKTDTAEIAWMKSDMAGAASVAGAVGAAVAAGADPTLTVVLPVAENMVSKESLRPGDVVSHPDGSTTEVTNTDCEGRLVLADALAWLATQVGDGLLDVGTLTDGAGFGPRLWSASGHGIVDELLAAGRSAGDPGWELPLVEQYADMLATPVADVVNSAPGSGVGGAMMAGLYLSRFTAGLPWAHVDNGGTAYLTRPCSPWPVGATGSPLRAISRFLRDLT